MNDVHLWVGTFESENKFFDYIEEQTITEGAESDSESTPLNQFIADQGEDFYDHDWFETVTEFQKKVTTKPLLRCLSFSSVFIEEAAKSARKLKVKNPNA